MLEAGRDVIAQERAGVAASVAMERLLFDCRFFTRRPFYPLKMTDLVFCDV
jgi:hypothetical protein